MQLEIYPSVIKCYLKVSGTCNLTWPMTCLELIFYANILHIIYVIIYWFDLEKIYYSLMFSLWYLFFSVINDKTDNWPIKWRKFSYRFSEKCFYSSKTSFHREKRDTDLYRFQEKGFSNAKAGFRREKRETDFYQFSEKGFFNA